MIGSPGEHLYVPITQGAAPITEDRLEDQASMLMGLGCDAVGSHMRARVMSSALLSDMEAFKAANPGSVLEDFVRWYSPRDWITDDDDDDDDQISTSDNDNSGEIKGHLSSRMLIPGNLWQEVWENAKPVPARRQKRLFDDTREAEQVLQWLANLPPGKVCQNLMPAVLHAALARLSKEPLIYDLPVNLNPVLPQPAHSSTLSSQLELIAQRVVRLSRQPCEVSKYEIVVDQLTSVEYSVACAQSVRHKLLGETDYERPESRTSDDENNSSNDTSSPLEKLVMELLHGQEVNVEGGPKGAAGQVIKQLFKESRKAMQIMDVNAYDGDERRASIQNNAYIPLESDMGKPVGREYLLRTTASIPSPNSRPLPQRLFAVLQRNNFRMCGAFTEDTIFY